MKDLVATLLIMAVAVCIFKAIDENSIGWGSAGITLMVYSAGWGVGQQLERGLNRLDEIARAVRRVNPPA